MNVKQAIEELKKLPEDAVLMIADLGVGGSCELTGFDLETPEWVQLVWEESYPSWGNHLQAPKK